MLKKTITYVDYNGVERTEDFYFNLSEAELAEMELTSEDGGLANYINKIVKEEDIKNIVLLFKKIILKSYGIKSDDGKRFVKSDEISKEFSETEAYSNLFIELAKNSEFAADFMNGLIKKN